MKKETLQKLMNKHYISSNNEAQEAIDFVMELLEAEADHTEETEPYATSTIDELIKASRSVSNLQDNL